MFSKSTHQFSELAWLRAVNQSWSGKNLTSGDFGFGGMDGQDFGHGMFGGIRHFDNKESTSFTDVTFLQAQSSSWSGDDLRHF